MPVGHSDHSGFPEIPLAAVAMGAEVLEVHLTLDRDLPGPDHRASLLPHELKFLVRAARNVYAAMQ